MRRRRLEQRCSGTRRPTGRRRRCRAARPAARRRAAVASASPRWKRVAITRGARLGRGAQRPRRAGRARASPSTSADLVDAVHARVVRGLELDRGLPLVGDDACRSPARAATASNSRPALVVTGECDAGARPCARRRAAGRRPHPPPRPGRHLPPCHLDHATPIRHGSRTARVAARQPHGAEVADPLEPAQVAGEQLAAPDGAVAAVARAVEDRADRRPGLPVLGQAGRQVGVVVLDARRG